MRAIISTSLIFCGAGLAQAQTTTTNCYQYSAQAITCNGTTIPAPAAQPFYAPHFENPDILGSALRGQQGAIDAQMARQRMQAADQDAEIKRLQAQVLRNQIAAQEAATKREHSERLQRFRRSFMRLTQCIAKQPPEECSKQAEQNDPDFIGAREDARSGVLSPAEIQQIAIEVQNQH